jgi:hypothetical protein
LAHEEKGEGRKILLPTLLGGILEAGIDHPFVPFFATALLDTALSFKVLI